MTRFVATRILGMFGILAVLAGVMFALQAVVPADPVRTMLGPNASAKAVAETKAKLGLDKPLPQQYVNYVGNVAAGDLGMSLRTRRPVATDIGEFLPATLELAFVALALGGALGVGLGILSARGGRVAEVLRVSMLALSSAPVFLLAILLILLFYAKLGVLPGTGRLTGPAPQGPTGFLLVDTLVAGDPASWWDAVQHLVLPAFVLALAPAVAIGRTLNASLATVQSEDFWKTALAKGLSPAQALRRHGLRNAAGPALAMTGLQFGFLLAGVIVVETVFAWPGLGYYTYMSIPRADFPAIAGVTLVLGAAFVVVNALVDIVQAVADPRITVG